MSDPNGQAPTPPKSRARPRDDSGKYQKITRSLHRDDYEQLIRSGWSTRALSRYAAFRYGETISHMAFARYREKYQIEAPKGRWQGVEADGPVDILGTQEDMIRLQIRRIGIDHKHESDMTKLFGTTGKEIQVLKELVREHKETLQDLGMFPKVGDKLEIIEAPAPEEAPRAETLHDLFSVDEEVGRELAKVLHLADKRQAG